MISASVNILIVDDLPDNIALLQMMLRGERYNLFESSSGNEALAVISENDIDVVLLDIRMPEMDGIQTAQKIQQTTSCECHLPIIYVTAVNDSERLSYGLTWADDFLVKPVMLGSLITKIEMQYQHRLFDKVRLQELVIVEEIFRNVVKHKHIDGDRVRFIVTPMSVFSGDVVLVNSQPQRTVVLIGDFTGHGLPAAMGIIPASKVFNTLTANHSSIGEIARETNHVLLDYLPDYMFLAGIYVCVDHINSIVNIWSAAMPAAIVTGSNGGIKNTFDSLYMPIGAISEDEFDGTTYQFTAQPGDKLFLCSDGIIEATNGAGEMFGESRYEALFTQKPPFLFQHIINSVNEFTGVADQRDDISLVEINLFSNHTISDA